MSRSSREDKLPVEPREGDVEPGRGGWGGVSAMWGYKGRNKFERNMGDF